MLTWARAFRRGDAQHQLLSRGSVKSSPRFSPRALHIGQVAFITVFRDLPSSLLNQDGCVDCQRSVTEAPQYLAASRQHTSVLLQHMENDDLSTEEHSTKLAIYHKMGAAHAKAGEHEAAETAYSKAHTQCTRLMSDLEGTNVPGAAHSSTLVGCMSFTLDRLSNAWKLRQPALASECISQATMVLQLATLPLQQRLHMRRQDVLNGVKRRKERQSSKIDAQGLLDHTHQFVTQHLEMDKNYSGLETSQKEAKSLQAQVLRLLSQAYLLSGQEAHTLACVKNMRKLQDSPDDALGLCLTAIEALIQLDRPQQVDAELLALVEHKDASADLCLAALTAVIQARRCNALKPAADIVLKRFAKDATVPLRMVEALLGASEGQKISGEKEALALDIARNKKVLQLLTKVKDSTRDQRKSMYTLLWNHANQLFASRDFTACENFCTAVLGYAEANARADVKRQMVQAKVAQMDLERALRSLDPAADSNASSFAAKVPESQVLRMKEEARKVLDQMRLLLNSNNSFMGIEMVVMPVVERVSHPFVAYLIWRALWAEAVAVHGPSKRPGHDAIIVAGHMKSVIALKEHNDLDATIAEDRDRNSNILYKELAHLFRQAEKRLEAVGRDSFFGPDPVASATFADSAWDIGMKAQVLAKDPVAAAVILGACTSFYEAVRCKTPEQWKQMRVAYFMSAQCRLEEYAQHPERKPYCLSQIQDLHKKASAALDAAMQFPIDPEDVRKAKRCLFSMEFNLAEEQNEPRRMVPVLERAETQGLFTADNYLHFSNMCLDNPPDPHIPSAAAALRAALHVMQSQKKWPQMSELTQTVEELYKLGSDKEKVALLADIGAFLRSVKGPSYPSEEMSWLINTTWSLGRKHAQKQRNAQALSLMAAAIDLMDLSDEFSDSKEMFEAEMEKVQREALVRPGPPARDASSSTQAKHSNVRSRRPRPGLKSQVVFQPDP